MSILERVFNEKVIKGLDPTLSEAWEYLHRVFVDTDDHQDWSLRQRERLERLLSLADRHEQLNEDTIHRLTSPDAEQLCGRLNELKVADFFESMGLEVDFRPRGRASHEGEFLVCLSSRPVFTEVKTMFPRLADRSEERHLNRLCRAARSVHLPGWINVQILQEPTSDFRTSPFVKFLSSAVPSLMRAGKRSRTAQYEDQTTGLRVVITFMSSLPKGPVTASPFTGVRFVKDAEYIKASLKKASNQLPNDLPCMVVLCSHLRYPPSPTVFQNALYGTYGVLNEPRLQGARKEDGFFAERRHTRLSVVGFLDEFRIQRPPEAHMDLYHHPWPRLPLTPEELLVVSDRHWCAEEVVVNGKKGLKIWQPYQTDDET